MTAIIQNARAASDAQPAPRPAAVLLPALGDAATRLFTRLMLWQERIRQRRALLSLNDHLLKDMGISRADAESEALKPFWRD